MMEFILQQERFYNEPISQVFNCDCMEFMRTLPDKFFDLAIVDPPYGKNITTNSPNNFVMAKHKDGFIDVRPKKCYFIESNRVSKNNIIWGANYFLDMLTQSSCMIVWDKINPMVGKFSDFEIAYTSFDGRPSMLYRQAWIGFGRKFIEKSDSIHPTQKPVALYKWLLKNYTKPGDKIFDSHMGSQSSRIAAHEMGFDYWGCELDEDYFREGNKRFNDYKSQLKIFQP